MTKSEPIFDLIALALGMTTPEQSARLQSWLDLYVSSANSAPSPAFRGVKPNGEKKRASKTLPPTDDGMQVADQADTTGKFLGESAPLKRDIHNRLVTYRKNSGLGCFQKLSVIANGALTPEEIRDMHAASSFPLAKWKVLAAVLDSAEGLPAEK